MSEFIFHKNLDSYGYDLYKVNVTDIDTLKKICKNNPKCVGFNTLGYMKYYVNDTLKPLPNNKNENSGLYIYSERLVDIKKKNSQILHNIDGYIYYPNKDSPGNDLYYKSGFSIDDMKKIADADSNCIAFNTYGYFKNDIVLEKHFNFFCMPLKYEGLYVKIPVFNEKTRIKCINLERRQDRKENMINLLKSTNLLKHCDFFKAVDGKSLQNTPELFELFKNNTFGSRRSVIGCALSHYNLWKELLNDDIYDNYIIIEDDIKFSSSNPIIEIDKVFRLLQKNNDWDIVYLGYSISRNYIDAYNKIYDNTSELILISHIINISIGGTFGYLINKSGANKLLTAISKYGIKYVIDNMAYKYKKEMNINLYETVPRLITSEYVASDNFGKIDSDIHYNNDKLF